MPSRCCSPVDGELLGAGRQGEGKGEDEGGLAGVGEAAASAVMGLEGGLVLELDGRDMYAVNTTEPNAAMRCHFELRSSSALLTQSHGISFPHSLALPSARHEGFFALSRPS